MTDEILNLSRYTYLFISSKKKYLVYNSRTNSLFEISKELYYQLLECKEDKRKIEYLDDEIISFLSERKIIIREEEDSNFLLEHQYETDRRTYSKYILGLTIVPTLACNFSCHYCFEENKRVTTMNKTTEDAIISFINSHLESRELHLNWYGGEPLLAINTIESILNKISNETTLKFTKHNLITNGYFINDKVINLFKKYPLNTIQITLDGKRERHDTIRKTKGEVPTYDKITGNIDRLLKEFANTQVHIRINIEKNNMDDYSKVAKELKDRWEGKNIIIYPGFLRIDNEQKTAYSCDCLDKEDIAEFMFDAAKKKIIDIQLYPQIFSAKTCAATRQCSYIIGPEGEVYKCWNDVSDPQKVIGNIHTNKTNNNLLLNRYLVGSKWYNDSACRECFFLPICNGTCAWYVLRNKYGNGKYHLCTCIQKTPEMLNKCLEYFYDSLSLKNNK